MRKAVNPLVVTFAVTWIEIIFSGFPMPNIFVVTFAVTWIEIPVSRTRLHGETGRHLRGDVD